MKWSDYYERYDNWQESTQYSRLASISDWGPQSSPSNEITDCILYVDDRTAASILHRALTAQVRFRSSEVAAIVESGIIDNEALLVRLIQTSDGSYTGKQLAALLDTIYDNAPILEMIDKACSQPTHLTEEDILALLPSLSDDDLINKVVGSTDAVFTEDGLNTLCDYGIAEELVAKISRQSGIPYSDPEEDEDYTDEPFDSEPPEPEPFCEPQCTAPREKKPGLLGLLLGLAAADSTPRPSRTPGRCSGDCAHCPPHYGYRYGRWYYGHGHSHGCEFGGNGGCSGKCNRD